MNITPADMEILGYHARRLRNRIERDENTGIPYQLHPDMKTRTHRIPDVEKISLARIREVLDRYPGTRVHYEKRSYGPCLWILPDDLWATQGQCLWE